MKRILASLMLAATTATFPLAAEPAFEHKGLWVVEGYGESRSTLANFPVLVRIPAGTVAECRADGADIRFTSPDGETEYPHEIDAWNASGESTVWVLLPEMQHGTSFIMEWGDPDYTGPETPWAKGSVWDPAGYAGVWHMTEASGNVANATSKTGVDGIALDAIPSGTRATYSVRSADAPIGFARDTGAQDMNHDSNGRAFLRVPNYDNLALGDTFTISGWWKLTDYHGNYDGNHRTRNGRMFSRKNSWKMNGGFEYALNNFSTVGTIAGAASDSNDPKVGMSGLADCYGNWVHMAFIYNGSTATAFVNGVQKGSGRISPATDCGLDLGIGSNVGSWNGVYNNDSYIVGLFDEMRLQDLNSEMTMEAYADWFAAEYAMGADAAFLTYQAFSQTTPVVSIAIDSTTSREWRNESRTITLTRSSDSAWCEITVNLGYTGTQSLVSGLPATVTMQINQTSATIAIPVVDNDLTDGDRNLAATVLAGDDYEVGATSSVSLTILDDETHAQVCNWTGSGDGTLWSDADNWSSHTVPTEIDTVVFGNGVSANLEVTFASGETIEKPLSASFETPYAVTLGTADGPAFPALDFTVAVGAGTVTFGAEFVFSSATTITAAEDTEIVFTKVSGEYDFMLEGAGTVDLGKNQDGGRLGGATVVRGGTVVVSKNYQLGNSLIIGGADTPAVVRVNPQLWGEITPYANGSSTEILRNGFLDLTASPNIGTWQKNSGGTGPIFIRAGGSLSQGNRRFEFGSGSVTNLFLEGSFEGSTTTSIDLKDNSWLVRPATATEPLTIPTAINVNPAVKFLVEDVPNVNIDLTLSGTIGYAWHPHDGMRKEGAGVLRLTGANTYGGYGTLANGEGATIVNGGILLVDNDPDTGSGTGNSLVHVKAGAVLGGTGRIGGLVGEINHWSYNYGSPKGNGENTCVSAAGTAEAQAVIAPGTIDDETGAHVIGTLTVGVEELHHPVTFGEYSSLAISAGREGADALVVHGTVDIAETGTQLAVAAVGNQDKVRSGTFAILEADEITGEFATVSKPGAGWRVSYESEEVDGQSVTKRVILTVPGAGTVMVFR